MTDSGGEFPIGAVVGAALLAVASFVVAGTVDVAGLRLLAAVVGVVAAVGAVRMSARRSPMSALAVAACVPIAVLAAGAPIAGTLDSDSAWGLPGPERSADTALDDQLAAALDHADELVPNGSTSILQIRFGRAPELKVLDTRNGRAISASWDEDGWNTPTTDVARDRRTFSKADVSNLSLNAAEPKIVDAAKQIGDSGVGTAETVELKRRDADGKLLASFTADYAGRSLQVDADGALPDTLDMSSAETVLIGAARVMRAAGLDPKRTPVREFDFRTTRDGASFPGASSIMNSGGVVITFDGGPVSEIEAIPGEFPIITRGDTYSTGHPFVLADLSPAVIIRARDDLARRESLFDADKQLVGFQAGSPFGDPRRIRMSVGPTDIEGMYTFSGRYVGAGH